MYIYVCVHIYKSICIFGWAKYTHMLTHTNTRTYTHNTPYTHAHTHTRTQTHTHTHEHKHTRIDYLQDTFRGRDSRHRAFAVCLRLEYVYIYQLAHTVRIYI